MHRSYVPPPLPVKKPEWFGGSAKALGYTWHLSVVNAGAPRSVSEATAIYRLTAATTTAAFNKACSVSIVVMPVASSVPKGSRQRIATRSPR